MPPRPHAVLAAFVSAALLSPAPPARADEVDEFAQRMVELEAQVRELDITLKSEGPNAEAVERRIIDGQVLYELKNYEAASIILLDVVERHPEDRSWPEALFYLADALYLKHDYLTARRYFERSVSLGPGSRHYQDSLERLIELALHTSDYSNVDDYLTRLGSVGRGSAPSVVYIEGKYQFFRERYEPALARLQVIQRGQPYWFQAQYFIGAIKVAQGRPGEAVQIFDTLAKTEPHSDSDKRILELTHLALGRIYYDQGQVQAANAEYAKIKQGSELFTDALYEGAWVAIKDRQFAKAYRSLDLLMTIQPDSPQSPEIKLLMSNLQVRQGMWDEATRSFVVTRDQFDLVKKDLDEAMKKQGNSETFFRDVLSKNLDRFDLGNYLPPSAAKWAQKEPNLEKLAGLIGDEADLRKSLEESVELIGKLEKAMTGPSRVNIFPELAQARTRALLTGNRLLDLENRLIQREHDLVVRTAGRGSDAQSLERATAARQRVQRELSALPRGKDSYEKRIDKARSDYDELDKRAVELNVVLANVRAEIVALEKYANDTHQAEDPATRESFERQLGEAKQTEAELNTSYEQIRRDIAEASQAVGVDDVQMQAEAGLKRQLDAAQQTEHEAMSALRGRLGAADRTKADQIEQLLSRARGAQSRIDDFNGKIEGIIDHKLGEMHATLADEKTHLADYQKTLGSYRGETTDVGAGVTAESFRAIADRFYQIVVRADVGIIDVAWALKQSKTDQNARLVREKKRELKLLDDEFKDVLKD